MSSSYIEFSGIESRWFASSCVEIAWVNLSRIESTSGSKGVELHRILWCWVELNFVDSSRVALNWIQSNWAELNGVELGRGDWLESTWVELSEVKANLILLYRMESSCIQSSWVESSRAKLSRVRLSRIELNWIEWSWATSNVVELNRT